MTGATIADSMTLRQKLTWCAHLWKAASQQHHREMRAVLGPYVPPDGVVFDVGAHSGQFTKLFARMVPHGHVHAFEPGSYALSLLQKVCALHRLRNITVHRCGLGDADATLRLNVPIKKSGSLGFGLSFIGDPAGRPGDIASEDIHIRRLDDIVAEAGITRADLIKADIEGSELRMLVGAKDTLRRLRPAIFVEVNEPSLARRGDSAEALAAFLKDLRYTPVGGWAAFEPPADFLFVPDEKA
jgi:FkbM family methyltransferase